MAEREVEGVDLDSLEEFYEAFEIAVAAALAVTMAQALKSGAVERTASKLSLDDLNVIPGIWATQVPQLADDLTAIYVKSAGMQADAFVRAGGVVTDELLDDVAEATSRAVMRFTSEHAAAIDYLATASNRLVGIGDDLWFDARSEILNAMDLGESIDDMARRVQKTADVTAPRARMIARSEAVSASNSGSIAFMRATGEVATKAWLAHLDDRTRPEHRAANGQEVDLEAKFMVGGVPMDHPGDPTAPARLRIQCRCTMKFGLTPDAHDLAQDGDTLAASAHEETAMTMTFVEGPTDVETVALVAAMDPDQTAPWEGVLCVEGQRTGDHRAFEGISWGNLPMPLRWNQEDSHGGMPTTKAVLVGRIDAIEKRGAEIWGTGLIDLGSENGREVHRLMGTPDAPAFLSGVSIDADDPMNGLIEVEFPAGCDTLGEGATPDQMIRCSEPELVTYHDIRIRAATLVDIPAIVTGQIYLTGMAEFVGPDDVEEIAMAASINEPTMADVVESLTAAAATIVIPDLPPSWWFDEPQYDTQEIGAITISDEGRLYGLLAAGGVRHRSYPDKRVEAPTKKVDYSLWSNRPTLTLGDDGETKRVATGAITMNCPHFTTRGEIARSSSAAMEHYEQSCSIFATAAVGETERGDIWVAGAILPDVTWPQIARALACQLSGDWRPHSQGRQGWRELAGMLIVPVPGLPVANRGPKVSFRGEALVASSAPIRFEKDVPHDCGCSETEQANTANAARVIAESVGRGKATRARELYLSVKG